MITGDAKANLIACIGLVLALGGIVVVLLGWLGLVCVVGIVFGTVGACSISAVLIDGEQETAS